MEAASNDPVTSLVTLFARFFYSKGLKFELLAIVDRSRESGSDTSAKYVCYNICHQLENMNISSVLDGSFSRKSFAVHTAQPTLPCDSSQGSAPGKSHHHAFFFFRFPGVVDHDCLMQRTVPQAVS